MPWLTQCHVCLENLFLMLFRSTASKSPSAPVSMLLGLLYKWINCFSPSFCLFVPLLNPLLLPFHLLLFSLLPLSIYPPPPLCFPFLLVPEMDMGLPGEGDSSINALCCQINTSFTKPSDELFSNPSLSTNGPPTCTVPPVLPPPPAPMQGKHQINRNVDSLNWTGKEMIKLTLNL